MTVVVAAAAGYALLLPLTARSAVYNGAMAALVAVVGLRVWRLPPRRRPWWLVVLLGFTVLAVGNVVWDAALRGGADPTGGVADWMFVAGYALTAVGLVGVAAGHIRGGWINLGLEAIAAGVLVGALAWVWGGAAAIHAGDGAGAVAAALLVVFSTVRALAMLRLAVEHRHSWRLAVAGLAMVVWLTADVLYAGMLASVTYKSTGWLDAVWLAALVLVAIGLAGRRVPSPDQADPPGDRHVTLARRIALVATAGLVPAFVMFSALTELGDRLVLAAALVVVGLAVVVRVELLTTGAEGARRQRDEAEARYEQLFDQTASPMLLLDPADGRIVDANPAAADLYGHTRSRLQRMRISQLNTLAQEQIATEIAPAHRNRGTPFEFRHRLASGEVIPVDVYTGPITVDGEQLLLSIVHDASARHAALDELHQTRAQWRQLAELAQDMVYRATYRDGRLVSLDYVNPAGQSVLGVSPTSLMADPMLAAEHLHDDDRRRFLSIDDDAQDRTSHEVFRWRRPDGELVHLDDRRASSAAADGTVTVVGVVRDVTTQHRTEQALRDALHQQEEVAEELHRVNQMKSTFLQAVSHELRTPLTSLLGFLATLHGNSDKLDEPQRELLLDRAHANAQRLRRLLDNLLDVNRLANDLVVPEQQTGDIASMLNGILATVDHRDHPVHADIAHGHVVGDLVLIESAVENLVDNALRHTPPGTDVHLRAARHDQLVEIIVEDDGPGLPDELVGQVFEPFTQGPQARTDPNPGIGIGLTLTAQIAAVHGGTLTAENRHEGGARLRLQLQDPSPGGTHSQTPATELLTSHS